MIGAVHKSYARGCATHEGNNRAYTLHGVHYLRLENNIAYHVKGHNVFIEDAAETKNIMRGNLIMNTVRSMSLLNTDQSPASFWITHPDNAFIENHAAGSDRYSYWYDLQTHAMGPSANINICSENVRVGEFRDNVAHSNGRYGLRIFHNMVPRKYPCKPVIRDPSRPDDMFWQNPLITANFNGLTSYKNQRAGAIFKTVGDIRLNNFKVADNLMAGIEMSVTEYSWDDMAGAYNALVIGRSANTEESLEKNTPKGIITPRTDNCRVKDARFFNFDWGTEVAAFSSCSHCWHDQATDSGARTIKMSGLEFTNVKKRIHWDTPFKGIYYDVDGSLTGLGPKTWATPYYKHMEQPECTKNLEVYDGVICDSTAQVRRVSFYLGKPVALMGMGFKILRYDDSIVGEMTSDDLVAYHGTRSNFGTILFKEKTNPGNSWTMPLVTGHKYRVHWGITGVDFESMRCEMG